VDPAKVRDKDGISAAVDFLSLVAELQAQGTTLAEHQAAFDERFGAYASAQISIRVTDLAAIGATMDRLRANPPATVGDQRVDSVDDFIDGFGSFGASNILRLWVGGTARVIVRPSGSAAERRAAAEAQVAALDAAMRALVS